MAKKLMPASQHATILREAREVEAVLKMPGWKTIAEEIREQMEQAKNQLAENRLRTIHETVKTAEGEQTFITTAETQIGETAGMYKMGKWVLDLVDSIVKGPSEVERLRQQGVLIIEDTTKKKQTTKGGETHDR